jgi:hypothetical protein
MKKQFNINLLLYILTILVSILYIITLFSTLTDYRYGIIFSSDTLYQPALFKDLFIDHKGLQGWYLNPSPNFFPDMIVYFILMFLTKNFIVTTFVYPILQYLLFLMLILMLFRLIVPDRYILFAAISNLLLLLFILTTLYSKAPDFDFTFFIISISFHMGAFLMSFLCLIMTLNYIKNPKKSLIINLVWIGFLSVLSDRLFIVMYSLPALSILLLFNKIKPFNKILHIVIINILTVGLGFFAFWIIQNSNYIWIDRPHRILDFNNSINSFHMLIGHILYYLKYGTYTRFIIIISILSFITTCWLFVSSIHKENKLSLFTVYCLLSISYSLIVFFAPVINGNYTASDSLRYNIYVYYISIINIPLLTAYFLTQKYKDWIVSKWTSLTLFCMILYTFWIGFSKFSPSGLHQYFNYYPEKVKQMDKIARENHLSYGIGNYWTSNYITLFSKSNVRVLPVYDAIFPQFHAFNKNWFFDKNTVINFVVLFKIQDRKNFMELFGNSAIKLDSTELEVMQVPPFRFDPQTFKIYPADSIPKN